MRPFPTYNPTSVPFDPSLMQDTTDADAAAAAAEGCGGGGGSRRNRTSFYLPSPDAGLSRVSSRHSRRHSNAGGSIPTSPSHLHRRSRTSLAGLRSALQTYQVPSEPRTPSRYSPTTTDRPISDLDLSAHTPSSRIRLGHGDRALDYEHSEGYRSRDVVLRSPEGLGQEMMDALVEIHRVLYRGREDVQYINGRQLDWDQQGQEVKRVFDRWFEGDCTYDHPLVKVNSRESLLTHFILLHLLSAAYLPSLTPTAMVSHARHVIAALRARLLGDTVSDLESATSPKPVSSQKGKEKVLAYTIGEAEWYGLDLSRRSLVEGQAKEERKKGWWKAWDVSADCREIGGMECYDGYHLALIEHTITLTLLPSLSSRRVSSVPSTPLSSASYDLPTAGIPPPSFLTRLAQGLAEEFDYLLHWDLPISTLVEFNEVGKATRIRDIIDVGDAIETFIPFAKRVGWLTRRLTGFVTSTLGAIATSLLVPDNNIADRHPIPVLASGGEKGLGLADCTADRPPTTRLLSDTSEPNSLGLEGVDPFISSAPDCDAEALVQDDQ